MLKKEIRVLGIDDAPFDKFNDKKTLLIGTFFRGGNFIDGVVSTKINVDGNDATNKIIELVKKTKFYPQLRAIMLDGIAVGGFNVIDITKIHQKTKIPVIVVVRKYPDFKEIERVLIKLKKKPKIKLLRKAGKVHKAGSIFIQFAGLDLEEAKEILKITCTRSFIPEPVRVAHIIASGLTYGESRGKP
jgi:hypothetical protein